MGTRKNDDDHVKLGRLDERAFKRLASRRIGSHGGRKARTFHSHVGSVKGPAEGTVDYLAREGDYSDRDDLEGSVIGDKAGFNGAAALVDAARRLRSGRTAEAVVKTIVRELPGDSTPESRRAVAEAEVRHWRQLGFHAVAAIHAEPGNPHMHVAVTARRVIDGVVDRTPGQQLFPKASSVMADRQRFAGLVNQLCRPEVQFFGGRDALMDQRGIVGRKPKGRLPESHWHKRAARALDPQIVAELAAERAAKRREAKRRAEERQQAQQARREAKARRWEVLKEVVRIEEVQVQIPGPERIIAVPERKGGLLGKLLGDDLRDRLDITRAVEEEALRMSEGMRPADARPATAKQISYLMDLLAARGEKLPDDAEMTNGYVGSMIGRLAEARQKPQEARKAPPAPQGRAAAPASTSAQLRQWVVSADPDDAAAAKARVAGMSQQEREKAAVATAGVLRQLEARQDRTAEEARAIIRLRTGLKILQAAGAGVPKSRTRSSADHDLVR